MPQTDTYIEKDATINDEIDRLRHSATAGLLVRNDDVIIVASVSAIYGWARQSSTWVSFFDWCRGGLSDEGCNPASGRHPVRAQRGQSDPRQVPRQGRHAGGVPSYEETIVRVGFWGDEVERIIRLNPVTGRWSTSSQRAVVFPATHYVTERERMLKAIISIEGN